MGGCALTIMAQEAKERERRASSGSLAVAAEESLRSATFNTHPEFTIESSERVPAIVLKIYDGDTAWLAIEKPVRATFRVRLLGLDTHEMRQPAGPLHDERKRLACFARNRLAQLCTNVEIDLQSEVKRKDWDVVVEPNTLVIYAVFGAPDKYGRSLATLYRGENDKESINAIMIQEGHAVAYDGGTKTQ